MTLARLYRIHDAVESALRHFEGQALTPVEAALRRALWAIHDALERVIIRQQGTKAR